MFVVPDVDVNILLCKIACLCVIVPLVFSGEERDLDVTIVILNALSCIDGSNYLGSLVYISFWLHLFIFPTGDRS